MNGNKGKQAIGANTYSSENGSKMTNEIPDMNLNMTIKPLAIVSCVSARIQFKHYDPHVKAIKSTLVWQYLHTENNMFAHESTYSCGAHTPRL